MLCLAKFGILPKSFLKFENDLPPYVSCMFGQAHRKPWCHKCSSAITGGTIRRDKRVKPGTMVYIYIYTDQLVSAQPGLVPQEKGSPTRSRIWARLLLLTANRLYKVHLMQDATGESTLEAKAAFEQDARSRGIDIRRYYCLFGVNQ